MAEALVVEGDLSKLTPAQRIEYYVRVCKSLGLNPLTRPFQYIKLQGKLTLYATRDATDQIRNLRNISVRPVRREFVLDNTLYIVEVEAELPNGRKDFATAAVPVKGLTGDALANAIMKCETKAKRRVTLSIAGLGMLDETEIETIPDAQPANGDAVYPQADDIRGGDETVEWATDAQVKKIHVLARKAGLPKEDYRQTLEQRFGVDSSRKLTAQQANEFIEYLQSLAEQPQHEPATEAQQIPEDQYEAIKQQCFRLGFSTLESIAIRSAINRADDRPCGCGAGAGVMLESKQDALRALRMVGVPNPFKKPAAAGT